MFKIDELLNKITMYKVVSLGLMALWLVAEILALTGLIGVSAGGMLVSLVVLGIVIFGVTAGLAAVYKAPYNSESYIITALILVFILPPVDSVHRLLLTILVGVLAAASKYLLVWRGTHIFNPAAFAAFVVSITGLLPVTWWVATPWLTPFTALLVLAVLRKQRKFSLFAVFALVAVAMLLLNGLVIHDHGQTITGIIKNAVLSWPIIFMGGIMLTEPFTMPSSQKDQLIYALLVAVLFTAQINIGALSTTPQFALLIGNIFAFLVVPPFGAMLKLVERKQLAPDILELTFAKPKNLYFSAGQYIEMTVAHPKVDARGNRRSFSIASAPSEKDLRIAVRTYVPSSSFKSTLGKLSSGVSVRAAHVAGHFTLPTKPNEPTLLIAGGIGITPFRSQVVELTSRGQQRDIVLIYLASNKKHFVYKDVFEHAKTIGLKAHYVTGRITVDEILALVPDILSRQVYISGPDAMVTNYKQNLHAAGVARQRLHTDHFSGY